jgi:hypothetical protein
LCEHDAGDGDALFRAACDMGLEGIVSKKMTSSYRSGKCKAWVKVKNQKAPGYRRGHDDLTWGIEYRACVPIAASDRRKNEVRDRMWSQLLAGAAVSFINFAIHAVITGVIVVGTRHTAQATSESGTFARLAALLTITMVALMCAHVIEIAVWSVYYDWNELKLNNATHFEFAFENYTALGYGDALPVDGNRLIGPITALNGLLLIGWSVAVIFEVMRMAELKFGRRSPRTKGGSHVD